MALFPKQCNRIFIFEYMKFKYKFISVFFMASLKSIFLPFQADPYIEIELGKKKINDRDDYVPNTTDPVFGRYD